MKKKVGYIGLVATVLRVSEEDVLPLREQDIKIIDELVDNLPSWRRDAVRLYFGLVEEGPYTCRKAADKLGIHASAVQRHEAMAVRMLRHPSRAKYLERLVRPLLERQLDDQAARIIDLENKVALVTALAAKEYGATNLAELLTKSVDEFDFSVRTYLCLRNADIKTIGELVQKTEGDMLRMKNFGRKSLNELKEFLHGMNLRFGMKF